jgi:hypothetical protein
MQESQPDTKKMLRKRSFFNWVEARRRSAATPEYSSNYHV